MKKKSFPTVAFSMLLAISTTIILSVFTPSCTKLDVNEHRGWQNRKDFFDLPANADPALKKVVAEFDRQNKLTGFVNGMVAREGMPVWEKSRINRISNVLSRDGDENEANDIIEIFTPLVLENADIVNAFFFSKIVGDSVELRLYRANDFDEYPNGKLDSNVVTAEMITMELLGLNEEIFGHREYELLDTNLFKKSTLRYDFRSIQIDTTSEGTKKVECGQVCYYLMTPECISPTNICSFCQFAGCEPRYCTPPPLGGGYNWPPDPPIYVPTTPPGSGGGGTSTPSSGGNCTGGSNCRTGGSAKLREGSHAVVAVVGQ
jgi:hypothetical protein